MAKKSKSTKSKSNKALAEQPMMAKLIARCRKGTGATVVQLQKHLGGVASHTVRSMLSRLSTDAGVRFKRERDGRTVTYSLPAA